MRDKKKKKKMDKRSQIGSHLKDAKSNNFNKDRSIKTPDEFADSILRDMKPEAVYSTSASYYDVEDVY